VGNRDTASPLEKSLSRKFHRKGLTSGFAGRGFYARNIDPEGKRGGPVAETEEKNEFY